MQLTASHSIHDACVICWLAAAMHESMHNHCRALGYDTSIALTRMPELGCIPIPGKFTFRVQCPSSLRCTGCGFWRITEDCSILQ